MDGWGGGVGSGTWQVVTMAERLSYMVCAFCALIFWGMEKKGSSYNFSHVICLFAKSKCRLKFDACVDRNGI